MKFVRARPGHQLAYSGDLMPDLPTCQFYLPDFDAERSRAREVAVSETPSNYRLLERVLVGLRAKL